MNGANETLARPAIIIKSENTTKTTENPLCIFFATKKSTNGSRAKAKIRETNKNKTISRISQNTQIKNTVNKNIKIDLKDITKFLSCILANSTLHFLCNQMHFHYLEIYEHYLRNMS